jgi:hypothetical protein
MASAKKRRPRSLEKAVSASGSSRRCTLFGGGGMLVDGGVKPSLWYMAFDSPPATIAHVERDRHFAQADMAVRVVPRIAPSRCPSPNTELDELLDDVVRRLA